MRNGVQQYVYVYQVPGMNYRKMEGSKSKHAISLGDPSFRACPKGFFGPSTACSGAGGRSVKRSNCGPMNTQHTCQRATHQTWANLALPAVIPLFDAVPAAADPAEAGRVASEEAWTCTMSPHCDSARRNRISIVFRQRCPPASTSKAERYSRVSYLANG